MQMKVALLSVPNINLQGFHSILDDKEINSIDRKPISPTAKFAALVDAFCPPDNNDKHLYVTLAVQFPIVLSPLLLSYEGISYTVEMNNLMVTGIMSGSIDRLESLRSMLDSVNDEITGAFAKLLNSQLSKIK